MLKMDELWALGIMSILSSLTATEFSVYDGCDVENGSHNEKKQVVGLS